MSEESEARTAHEIKELKRAILTESELIRQHISNTMGSIAHETEMNKGHLLEIRRELSRLVSTLTDFCDKIKKMT